MCARSAAAVALVVLCGCRLGSCVPRPQSSPTLQVVITCPSADTALSAEVMLARPLEESLAGVVGVEHLRVLSSRGSVVATLFPSPQQDLSALSVEVASRVAALQPRLPADAAPPILVRFGAGEAVFRYALTSDRLDRASLSELDEVVRRKLEAISGVAMVEVCGSVDRRIVVAADPQRLSALGIAPSELQGSLAAASLTIPGGRLLQGDVIRVEQGLTLEGLRDQVIATRAGREVPLSDVATIEDGVDPPECVAQLDGRELVAGTVRSQSGASPSEVRAAVLAGVALAKTALPPGAELRALPPGGLLVHLRTPPGTTVEERVRLLSRLAATLRSHPGVEVLLTARAESDEAQVRLLAEGGASPKGLAAFAMSEVKKTPGLEGWIDGPGQPGTLRLAIRGPDLEVLGTLAGKAREKLAPLPAVESVRVEGASVHPQIVLQMDRPKLVALGLTAREVALALKLSVSGEQVGLVRRGTDRSQVLLRIGGKPKAEELPDITIQAAAGPVPLSSVVTMVRTSEPARILRSDRQRQVEVLVQARADCPQLLGLAGIPLPPGYLVTCEDAGPSAD